MSFTSSPRVQKQYTDTTMVPIKSNPHTKQSFESTTKPSKINGQKRAPETRTTKKNKALITHQNLQNQPENPQNHAPSFKKWAFHIQNCTKYFLINKNKSSTSSGRKHRTKYHKFFFFFFKDPKKKSNLPGGVLAVMKK